jgi:hypothetical protein
VKSTQHHVASPVADQVRQDPTPCAVVRYCNGEPKIAAQSADAIQSAESANRGTPGEGSRSLVRKPHWPWDFAVALRAEQNALQASIEELNQRGGRVKLSTCGPRKHLCVLVDEAAGTFGDAKRGEVYMIAKGY